MLGQLYEEGGLDAELRLDDSPEWDLKRNRAFLKRMRKVWAILAMLMMAVLLAELHARAGKALWYGIILKPRFSVHRP
ncbi:hypothetical protein ACM0P6_01570 [Komagataeibacter sucrofermentans]|uniref:Uncharacterized protein n=1 Tax=Komagataeibacter sucrofermentans TaxID=1053551 RepID=A0A318R018_9PROT|nr:hypothetical protein [Komagataeibacter sucrofermentans]PYD78753.1 hypothetical protein CFR77_09430 [Komagataeibacter sucrofermentans]